MERISLKENVLFEYGTQRSFENSSSDMDMDFNDVFGGPPRRFSIQEGRKRHSFNDPMEYEEDSAGSSRNSYEKPVFGAENVNRRRNQGEDFYDDIFRVDESPRRSDRDPFGSNPGSRVLSPVRPLSPKVEAFGTSLPAQFSLPAKLTKATDLPLFSSGSHSQHKKREKEMKNDAATFYRQSPLSREGTSIGDELRYMSESDEQEIGGNLKTNGESTEASTDEYQFHFSIYKWAGKGVPVLIPLKGGKHFKFKDKIKLERCSSSNGRIENDDLDTSSPLGENLNISRDGNSQSFSTTSKISERGDNANGIVGETVGIFKSKSVQSVKDDTILRTEWETEEPQFRQKTGLGEGIQIEIPKNSEETTKDELKPLRAFLVNEAKEKGDVKMAQETEGKSNTVKATKAEARSKVKVKENVKKTDDEVDKNLKKGDVEVSDNKQKSDSQAKRKGKRGLDKKPIVDTGVNRGSPQASPLSSTENSTKAGIKGKVQDFVKMFNHEVHSTPQEGESRSKSFRWKASSNSGVESEKSFNMPKANEKVRFPTVNKTQDATQNVHQNVNKQEKTTKYSQTKTPIPQTKDYSDQKAAPSTNESKRDDRKASVGSMDDLFGGNYVVEELFEDQDNASQTNSKSEDNQVSDAKIRQWSHGRKGNIRSLLSTLQLVLWPESGWKPVALMDLIEGSAVKRAYQRALLYIHPDKLQQKGAAAHQKYIAEKVFDILQEAWDHFNSLGPM
ncbi:J domain-containing protein required for chloroplast accumulation response 1 [Nicotiana tabacum]|uniref:J domain-containing protein required for chloroplast accumulation response 1 n=2 Tax=Nicotiana TaxID=4085 RepID=A0A1S4B2U2_TOBAC|nr:PREDICTED: J domain-containing protein required for chloroplast accumulation response 1 [Nicotiana sylvestris]XP_016483247.1 PREDICTED: J domain-containing protein required for chloroplast accumulation response 1-like [Nicotiana tabacum]